jgi:hypothetical protein
MDPTKHLRFELNELVFATYKLGLSICRWLFYRQGDGESHLDSRAAFQKSYYR